MSPEKWIRKPLPCEPGYNNCAEEVLSFTVSYDSVNDRLIITATMPVFGAIDSITFEGTGGNGTTTSLSIQSGTVVWITNAFAELLGPTTITQLDFFNVGPLLIGTWTGSEDVGGPLTIQAGSGITWIDTQSLPIPATVGCPDVLTSDYQPVVVLSLSYDSPDFDGVEVVYSDTTSQQFDNATSDLFEFSPGQWIIVDPALVNKEVAFLTAIDVTNAPIAPTFAVDPIVASCRSTASVTIDATQLEIVYDPMLIGSPVDYYSPGVDSVVRVVGCLQNGGNSFITNIYSPGSPNFGSNDPGFTINQWDALGIQIDTSNFTTPMDVDFIELQVDVIGLFITAQKYP